MFAVGASTHPGGGVPIVMQGAKLVEQAVQRYVEEELERKDVTMDEQDFDETSRRKGKRSNTDQSKKYGGY